MPDSFPNAILYFIGATFVLALLFLLISFRLFRRSRTDVYWRRRREAGQRGWRLLLLSIMLLVLSGLACAATGVWSLLSDDTNSPTVTTSALISTPTLSEATPGDQTTTPMVVIITTTPAHTPTDTPFPTYTPNVTPLVSSVTPSSAAQITITGLDDQISDDLTPVDPRTTFTAGINRIYMFVAFRNMTKGVLWHRDLYQNGALIDTNAYLWGLETTGNSYFFFGSDSGFEPGSYEIRLFIGSNLEPVSAVQFTIVEPS